ncbi:hypothetical protein RHMOL_Rhmol03G0249400 [Rhododendron molle]|uniref:Uncharacterized protein n=1 Tax=Rhododendron molle TaxID=49168 RepID=A0ACC0PIA2_RHOML|nr:hypothetical protein RHMOL_Rhmol03G0249400 [Rhododendron molle]
MARAVVMRPNAVVLRAFQSRFFTTHSLLPCFRPGKPVLVLAQKGYPRTHTGWGSGGVFGSLVGSRRSFCIRATTTQVNDSGSIDSPLIQSMEKKIKEDLNAESVTVKDAYGDGRHVMIDVISSSFEGQSAVNRQRMVYKAIWEELQSIVHAVDQMTTRTPAEAEAKK